MISMVKVALPKHHSADEVADIYRLTARSGGVFINPALTEPFGLTLLEAAATGLPLVATENGGPVDIIGNCKNGLLVDPLDRTAIAEALLKILEDRETWQTYSENGLAGVRRFYSWQAHAESYRAQVGPLTERHESIPGTPPMRRSLVYRDRALFTDLDQSLLGDPEGVEQFVAMMKRNKRCANFGIVTGRRLDSVLIELKRHGIPVPDVLITSLGTEIHYSGQLVLGRLLERSCRSSLETPAVRRALAKILGWCRSARSNRAGSRSPITMIRPSRPRVEEI
jgi:sucrose-phosphate synthase